MINAWLTEHRNYQKNIISQKGLGLTLYKISLLEDNKMATRSNVFCRQHHSVDVLKKTTTFISISVNNCIRYLRFGPSCWCLSDIVHRHIGSSTERTVGYTHLNIYLNISLFGVWLFKHIQIISSNIFREYFNRIILFLHSTQAREREKSYETITTGGQTQYINMTENTHHYDVIGYKSERMQDSCS